MTAPQDTNDAELEQAIQLTQDGQTAAFEVVVRRFETPLRIWLAGHLPPGIDVDEVAQRTFVAAFSRLDEYTPETRFGAWLFTIARYQMKTELTRLRRVADYHARYAPDLLKRELQRRSSQPPEILSTRLDHLKQCLDGLGDHLCRYVRWRYDEEISLEEMASRSNRSVAAMKKQLWLIRQQLQACVESRMATSERTNG
ncbi:RNA polymerase sigma factor CnrH [Rubripirellula lacrimiformis]|uniref:RNA polymerase sigma factor n=1 Tax=Rubripirellula lacrimiformis TaxID=1930273 RepID=A0A517NIX6_9BACT|nr:sigma-70 family RNA polymerase sigma factor [Rubripirellula lacrimiformis]QDT07084.1 RNA polymerase sigma factor CnrH [Rubripirellula lacrimiformis]